MANPTAQIRDLLNYIGFLEAKAAYFQHHHEHCDTWAARPLYAGVNLSYAPPGIVVGNGEANDESRHPQAISSPSTALSLPAMQPANKKRTEGNPRWKQIVDQITKGWDKSSSWIEKREAIGFHSGLENKYALAAILGLKKDLPLYLARGESPPFTSGKCVNATETLVSSARQYALDSKAPPRNTGLVSQVCIFRELVFVSLCIVLERQGLPIDTIDSLMRICISSSGSANLYRLRRGALWINRIISGTLIAKMGWGYRSTEFFFLCRIPYYTS
jgi:hypothetical protein